MKYIKLFNNISEYNEYKESDEFITPNICSIISTYTTIFNKKTYPEGYFTIESLEDDNQVSFTNSISYSSNNSEWNILNANELITVNTGDVVRFKSNLEPSEEGIGTFSASKNYNVKGNIMSLLYGDDFENKTDLSGKPNSFRNLFSGSTTLVSAGGLILPATTLADWCYYQMFSGCTSLTVAPELPATTLAEGCYSSMFSGCTSLTVAPELPATTLDNNCYNSMFYNCTSLTVAPELPATTLADWCYSNMFNGCSSLNNITMLATDISASDCLLKWVSGVSSTGIFYKNPDMTSLPTGTDGIPSDWEVKEYVNLITFTIDGIQYQAEEGMTWDDWVNSEYNTGGFYKVGLGGVGIYNPEGYNIVYSDGSIVLSDSIINNGDVILIVTI